MATNSEIKNEVREFYDQVGWSLVDDGVYQNSLYEDLRPVSREYIHRCHMRVARHINPRGEYLLDAGSGPIQYPEYLEYSKEYKKRVCVDISITALREARKKIDDHGLFVVADISKLPFISEVFDALVSLHTIHHLPHNEHIPAYRQAYRVLKPKGTAVLVNGWHGSILFNILGYPIRIRKRIDHIIRKIQGKSDHEKQLIEKKNRVPKGTHVKKYNSKWLRSELENYMPLEILVWRSVGVKMLRSYIHPMYAGRYLLGGLYWLEELFPRFFGKYGQFPLIVINKAND